MPEIRDRPAAGNFPIQNVLSMSRVGCGTPDHNAGTIVVAPDTSVGGIAEYTCANGYENLSGDEDRVCQSTGRWSGSAPTCTPKSTGIRTFTVSYLTQPFLMSKYVVVHRVRFKLSCSHFSKVSNELLEKRQFTANRVRFFFWAYMRIQYV